MNALPILERELRLRARSRGIYWSRFAVVLAALLIWLPQYMWSGPLGTPGGMGRGLLNAVVTAAFLVSCATCLLTADVISSERREGTLGLLLLTRVRAFDVLVGKLGSAGLTSLCALVAFLPMLMIPVLAGGVTGGEAFRKGLVLPDTMFLALAAGLWASACGRERLKTARTALLLLAGIVLVPGLLDVARAGFRASVHTIGLLSPLDTLVSARDASYRASPERFWISLILVQAMAWALVVNAGFRLRRAWREGEEEATAPLREPAGKGETEPDGPWLSCSWTPPVPGRTAEGETGMVPPPSRPLDDTANPIAWLLQRQRGTQAILWAGALAGPLQYLLYPLLFRFVGISSYMGLMWPIGLVLSVLGSSMFAWAASRYFVEARRTDEIELLLTTPCGATELVSTQWAVLKRFLRWPMLVMVAPMVLQAGYVVVRMGSGAFGPSQSFRFPYAISAVISAVNLIFGVGALCWVGMWFGLKAGGQARVILWTICLVKGLPTVIGIACSFVLHALAGLWAGFGSSRYWLVFCLPAVFDLLFYLGLILLARQRLLRELATGEPLRFDLRQSISSAAEGALAAIQKARHWTA